MISRDQVDMSHNDVFIEPIMEKLNKDKSVIFTEGTGIGKSYVGHQIIDKYFRYTPVLVVAPNNALLSQWKKNINNKDNIDFWTYSKLKPAFTSGDYKSYGLIIFDETHHIAAPKWGFYSFSLANATDAKVIALTATPLRRDNVDSIDFFDEHIEGITTPEAIEKGILAPFIYISCYYEIVQSSKNFISKQIETNSWISEYLQGQFDLIDNTPPLDEILRDNMPPGQRKILVFYDTRGEEHDLEEAQTVMKKAYPNAKEWVVSYKYTKKKNDEIIHSFETAEDDICIMYSINIFNEGLHVDTVNTVVMFRRTSSFRIFEQEYGRLLSILTRDEKDHILFDFVGNAVRVHQSDEDFFKNAEDDIDKVEDKIITVASIHKDYTRPCLDVIHEVYKRIYSSKEELKKRRIFCESHNIATNTFDQFRKRTGYDLEKCFQYFEGKISDPNGRYYKKRAISLSRKEFANRQKFCEEHNINVRTFDSFRSRTKYSIDKCFQYFKGEIPGPSGKYYEARLCTLSDAEFTARKKFCDENGVRVRSFDQFRLKTNYTVDQCCQYFKGEIPGPKGKYFKKYKRSVSDEESAKIKCFCDENNINIGTFRHFRRNTKYSFDQCCQYFKGEIPSPGGRYYRKCSTGLNLSEEEYIKRKIFCENNGISMGTFRGFMRSSGYSFEQCCRYFKGEIPGPKGKYYCSVKRLSKEDLSKIKEFCEENNVNINTFDSFRNKSKYSLDDCFRYFRGEIPNQNGNFAHRSIVKKS